MSWFPKSKDHLPLTWWKGHAIYLAAYIAIGGVVSMVVTAILMAAAGGSIIGMLQFSYAGLVGGLRLWTPLTYVLVNPPDLFFLLSAFFFWRFGEDVEKFFGRRIFVQLFLALVLVTPVVLTIFGLLGAATWSVWGVTGVFFGVFLAFVTLYPRAQISLILFTLPAWVLATAIVGVNALIYLAGHAWAQLIMLASQVLTAYGFVRYQQGRWTMPSFSSLLKSKKTEQPADITLLPSYREKKKKGEPTATDAEKVDAILEKISQKGMQSLTAAERKLLEKASERLKKG
ncbi:rhomboid family protein [Roseimicrobium gellanilyticum]|uniref:Rhomboid family protein n=1 Tax=Roseimicrobium gellanilyticum TaxID=748857 RepID=A0A366HDF5_9BACT|nr:rhomboid family intramembrane serine protease [Roseimicrobium gellanilyticum]RBP39644.1 rhomboid family protein [Roseimicrobium gellanilyticum]